LKYLLATDICIFALRQRGGVLERLLQESPDDVAVSAMTEAELTFGALKSGQPDHARPRVAAFLEPMLVLPFDRAAAQKHADIQFAIRSSPIGERDLVTAAVAIANRLVLVTHHAREFSRIDGLALEDWAAGAGA
jgi:tRNA(fMet)-specific endonuclease VapC